MRRIAPALACVALGIVTTLAWANWPQPALPPGTRVDHVVVTKSARTLELLRSGEVIRRYRISLGRNPVGPKQREGDGRTPEGLYTLDYRNPRSSFYLSLHVSYPSPTERRQAAVLGINPGSLIMVHGIRNGLGFIGRLHRLLDWTNGCIALTDPEIQEVWRVVPDGTPLLIKP